MNCCTECFEESEIENFIETQKDKGDCDYCGCQNTFIADTGDVGNFIRNGVKRAYEPLIKDDTAARISYLYSLEEVISDTLSENNSGKDPSDLLNDLIRDSGPSERNIKNGEIDDLNDNDLIWKNSLNGCTGTNEAISWEMFKFTCKHFNRFFDLGGLNSSREKLLSNLKKIFYNMNATIHKEETLFRARKWDATINKGFDEIDLLKELGPSPLKKSGNNRMSPAGISYMYLSDCEDTCLAEINAQSNDKIIIGKFVTIRELEILDLSQETQIKPVSIYSEDYNHDENWINEFVKNFSEEISKQINENDKELDYVATQVLAEYIRKIGFNGIKYESSLEREHFNYVLFCTIDNEHTEGYHYDFALNLFFSEMEAFTRWMDLEMVKYGSCACKTSFIETQNIEVKRNIKTNENVKKKSCEQNFFVD